MGSTDRKGRVVPGLWHLLLRLYLQHFLDGVRSGVPAKRAIIYFKSNALLGAVYTLLQRATGQTNPSTASFAMNHSSLLPTDDIILDQRRDNITLYLASNKMLLGTDLSRIDLVILCAPYDQPAAMLQAAGRMSRRTGRPYRTAGQLYLLFNGSDLSSNNKNMSSTVRRLCREGSTSCTRDLLEVAFTVDTKQWEVGSRVVGEAEEEEDKVQVEHREEQQRSREFKLLQTRIGELEVGDNRQLLRLLQANPAIRQLLATSQMEEGSSSTTSREEGGEEEERRHCCHKHDLEK